MSKAEINPFLAPESIKQLQEANNLIHGIYEGIIKANGSPLKIVDGKTYVEASNKRKEALSIEEQALKQLVATERRAAIAATDTAKKKAKVSVETQLLNKALREEAKAASSLLSPYEKLSLKLERARKKAKDLGATFGENDKRFISASKYVGVLDSRIKSLDSKLGLSQRKVGNYGTAFDRLKVSIGGVMGAFGLAGGIYMFANIIRKSGNIVKDFDSSMQTLTGVFRTTRKELAPLEAVIDEVGKTTVRTATETAQLAESLATLGKSPEEIKKLLKPVTDLSVGLKTSSDSAGEFLVKMINTFGGSVDEAEKYADVIGTIRTSTSLDFQKMQDSFQYLAPISKSLNKDLAYTGAVIGILADNGIKAERGGRLLSTAQQKLAKEGLSLADALEMVNEKAASGADELELLGYASDLFGKQASGVGLVLAQNSDKLEVNAQKIRDNGGALNDLVNSELDSLDGKLQLLNSAWEGIILNTSKSSDAVGILKSGIGFLTDNLETITEVTFKTISAFVLYKLAVISFNVVSAAYTSGLVVMRIATVALNGGFRKAVIGIRAFKIAMATTGIGLFVIAVTGLVFAMSKLSVSAMQTADELHKANEAFLEGATKTKDLASELDSLSDRYDYLTNKTSLNKDEQKELDEIIKKLAVSVPEAVVEFDKYGNALVINTDKVREFNEENKKILGLEAQVNIENQTKALKKLEKEYDKFINTVGAYTVRKEGAFSSNEYLYIENGESMIEDSSSKLKVGKYRKELEDKIAMTKKDIALNEDLIGSISGVKTERQKEAEEVKKEIETKEASIKVVRELMADIKRLKKELSSLTKDGYLDLNQAQIDNIQNTRASIKAKQSELDSILGTTKAVKKLKKELKEVPVPELGDLDFSDIENISEIIEKSAKRSKDEIDSQIDDIIFAYENGALSIEDYYRQLEEVTSNTSRSIVENTISDLDEVLDNINLNVESRKEAEERLFEFKDRLRELDLTKIKTDAEKELEANQAKLDEKARQEAVAAEKAEKLRQEAKERNIAIADATFQAIGMIADEMFSRQADRIAAELSLVQEKSRKEQEEIQSLADFGVISQEEATILKKKDLLKLEREESRLRREKAKADKEAALFNAIIGTAQAVVMALAVGPPQGYVLAGISAALGAIEIGLIASKPVPKFRTGVRDFEGGEAIVGDGGPELVEYKNGGMFLATQEIQTYLPSGTNVYTTSESKKMMGGGNSEKYLKAISEKSNKVYFSQNIEIKDNSHAKYTFR